MTVNVTYDKVEKLYDGVWLIDGLTAARGRGGARSASSESV
jgi:hypothetical protein